MSGDDDDREKALYKTYVQPLRVPARPADPEPPQPAPEPTAVLPVEPPPPPPEPERREPEPPPPPAATPAKDFEFRKTAQVKRRNHLLLRAGGSVVAAIAIAIAYLVANPFGSSSSVKPLAQYLGRVQPLVQRATTDRKSVSSAVNAVRRNPKGRVKAERQLVAANADRQALIRELDALGTPPGAARVLPARFTSMLQGQIRTARVWQRWMGRHPFVYLKNDAATRTGVQAELKSQQAAKGAFTRLYARLMRLARLPLAGGAGS